jgi:diketogulonate reductase-like aldo/keto reductase
LARVAGRHGATPAQVAIAWTIRAPGVVSIPKAARREHVRENAVAAAIRLTDEDLAELEREFPRAAADAPLEFL